MESDKMKSLSGQLKALMETSKDLTQKLQQRVDSESSKVENPSKFIVELLSEGLQADGSSDVEAHFVIKGMLVQLAVTIDCTRDPEGLDGLVKALESSGNLRLLSTLQTWAKKDFQSEADDDDVGPNEPEACTSAHESPPTKEPRTNKKSRTEMSPERRQVDRNIEILKNADNQKAAKTSRKVQKKKLKEKLRCTFCTRTFRTI